MLIVRVSVSGWTRHVICCKKGDNTPRISCELSFDRGSLLFIGRDLNLNPPLEQLVEGYYITDLRQQADTKRFLLDNKGRTTRVSGRLTPKIGDYDVLIRTRNFLLKSFRRKYPDFIPLLSLNAETFHEINR